MNDFLYHESSIRGQNYSSRFKKYPKIKTTIFLLKKHCLKHCLKLFQKKLIERFVLWIFRLRQGFSEICNQNRFGSECGKIRIPPRGLVAQYCPQPVLITKNTHLFPVHRFILDDLREKFWIRNLLKSHRHVSS